MVSIVVPIYNVEAYLSECLESLRLQSYADIEVVMVNDGSTDGSAAIARRFAVADSRFRLLNRSNQGPSAARNAGILECHGQYIAFLDSDDALHPRALEYLLRVLEAHPEVDMVMTDLKQSASPQYHLGARFRLRSGTSLLADTLYQKRHTHNSMSCRLVKSDILRKAGLMKEGIFYEDLDYCIGLYLACNKVGYSRDIVYFYRQTPGSITQTWKPQRLDALDVVDGISRRVKGLGPHLERAARSRRFSAYYNMFLLSAANNYPQGADRCWPVVKSLRTAMLTDPGVRFKNKAGALAACLGRRFVSFLARYFAGK